MLAFAGRQLKNQQIFAAGRGLAVRSAQGIVGEPEARGRKQVIAVSVVGEGTRFAHQRVDDVAILDAVPALAAPPGNPFEMALGVVEVEMVRVQAHPHSFADQATVNRVGVVIHPDRTERAHPHLQPLEVVDPSSRQTVQHVQLLRQLLLASGVALAENCAQKAGILVPRDEVAAAPQHQTLLDGTDEAMMPLLHVPVFVRAARVGLATLETVVRQQAVESLRELFGVVELVHGGTQTVGLMGPGHAPQLPQGVLQACAQGLEALGETDPHRLPVGVGEHEVVEQMGERASLEGDAE